MSHQHTRAIISTITTVSVFLTALHLPYASAQLRTVESREKTKVNELSNIGARTINSLENLDGNTFISRDGSTVEYMVKETGIDAKVTTELTSTGTLIVYVNGISEGEKISEVYDVDNFAVTGESSDNFIAALTGRTTGQSVLVNSEIATTQAIPALIVLGILARIGLRAAVNQFGKAQVKKAAKSYLLRQNANKWGHIMAPKHCWSKVGAKSKEQIADLLGRAMAEGHHSDHGSQARKAEWSYQGRTITATYNKNGGQISDGWVNKIGGKC